MKARLNITIEEAILDNIKAYVASKHMSISELVEDYFNSITKPVKRKNIISMVKELEKPSKVNSAADLKELYYKDREEKYGF